ncbi:hypothetical protein AYO38_09170 [bacterium SCGC AG-212-C10]|nr:hypothetical protein AYO38_09170 [bacterium SCGC AG-212-C10]
MPTSNFALVERAPQPAVVVRRTVKPQDIGQVLAEILPAAFGWAGAHGLTPAGAPFVRYLQMDGTAGEFDLEGGVPVDRTVEGDGSVSCVELPGGTLATAIYRGPYTGIGEAHQAIRAWIETQGKTVAGAVWESYITDPGGEPDSSKWETEVVYPLA